VNKWQAFEEKSGDLRESIELMRRNSASLFGFLESSERRG
jgi:hypothetical protein